MVSKSHLWHDDAYMVDTLDYGLAATRYSDCPFRRVWKHLTGNLDWGPCHLSDLFNFRPTLAYEGATLGGGHNQSKSNWWSWNRFGWYEVAEILKKEFQFDFNVVGPLSANYLFKFIAYECEGLENVFSVAADCDNSLGTASIADIYFRPTLRVIVLNLKITFSQREIPPRETSWQYLLSFQLYFQLPAIIEFLEC